MSKSEKFRPEQIVSLLRQVDGITEQTYCRRRKECGRLQVYHFPPVEVSRVKNELSLFGFIALLLLGLVCSAQTRTPDKSRNTLFARPASAAADAGAHVVLTLLDPHTGPVITKSTPGAENNKYGFEGGTAVKIGDTYHLATTEMPADPFAAKTRMAHWVSRDRIHWTRVSTLYESSGECDGKDPRGALWSPMLFYDEANERWNLFYVAYNCLPNTPTQWLTNYGGQIWHAVSKSKGIEGIGGPYEDLGIILRPDAESEWWEGLQGTDSFYPYRIGKVWYAFYGSANTEKVPTEHWRVGLTTAPMLAGPWKRVPELNPVDFENVYQENPVVTRASDGTYIAVYARGAVPGIGNDPTAVGYSTSRDGIHWSKGVGLDLQPTPTTHWARRLNTPLGLIPEGNDTFTLFYTGVVEPPYYESVGFVTLKLQQVKRTRQNR